MPEVRRVEDDALGDEAAAAFLAGGERDPDAVVDLRYPADGIRRRVGLRSRRELPHPGKNERDGINSKQPDTSIG
jgi:hypothetical protein